jgi:hypothetical protein
MKRVAVSRSDGAGHRDTIEYLLVSAYYDNHYRVVLVFVNYQSQNLSVKLKFTGTLRANSIRALIPYITNSVENLTACREVSVQQPLIIPKRSIVTFVTPAKSMDGVAAKK